MDLDEPIEPLRERAASSNDDEQESAASHRSKPFNESGDDDYYGDDQSTSRKRQRMESDEPESSTTAAIMSSSPPKQAAVLPTTPTRAFAANPPTTPTSNRVTLNLRSTRDLEPIQSSPHSSPTPSKTPTADLMDSNEPEVDANNIHPTIETPSSSLSSEPEIMLVEDNEAEYDSDTNPAVAIIEDDMNSGVETVDPTYIFPFLSESVDGSLQESASRLAQYFETGPMTNGTNFEKYHIWLSQYLKWARQFPEDAFNSWRDNREFWDSICDSIRCLTFRQPHFGNWLKTDELSRQSLSRLFRAFAMLAGQFFQIDLKTLVRCKEKPDVPLNLASRPFLEAVWLLIGRDEVENVGKWLKDYYSWDWDGEVISMHQALENQGASMRIFFEYGRTCLDLLPRFPKLIDNLREICRYIFLALKFCTWPRTIPISAQDYNRRIAYAYSFFALMEGHISTFIEKNATLLHSEYVLEEIASLAEILELVLENQHAPAEKRLRSVEESDPNMMGSKFLPRATAAQWKLSMLIRLITSSQMQLRVGATHSFCAELLRLYGIYIKHASVNEHPLTVNIGNYIVSTNLVDYIVGVGSHPEIISQSGDMIGFLAVTKTYTSQHTDKIWSTVKSSLDPRVVKSVLAMLHRMINLLTASERMYLCTKLQEIPVESFDSAMRGFCEELFKLVCQDAKSLATDLEAPPYEVCVRLIRESTAPRADTPMAFNEVQQWASTQFEILTNRMHSNGPDTTVRLQIYQSCLEDIRHGKTADGSLIALSILVEANILDLRQLAVDQPQFFSLLIENFSWRKTSNSLVKHLRLFRQIILMDFIKDSVSLGLQLWNKIIGAEEADLEREERQHGWKMLAGVMRDVKSDNVFMNACIHEYLPNLPPHLFSVASFNFARDAIGYFNTDEPLDPQDDDASLLDNKGVEQLWRMVLTSHDNAVFQNYAISGLISYYLESPTINKMPEEESLKIHLAFVNRCLQQLTSAAGKLKSFSEGTTSGDDEPMVIVALDKEVHEQETLFCRSLYLLKGFLRTYDSSGRFIPRKTHQIISPPEKIKGDVMKVSYQVFDDKTSSAVQSLSIGKLNTGASLFGSLQKAAAFENIRVHHLGKEVVPSEIDLSKSLDELKLGTHLILVSRVARPGPWSQHSPVHSEVIKRFDDLFELLSMDGTQAKDIYELLVRFPPYSNLLNAICSENASCQELFPAQHPYKSLYAMHCLRMLIIEKLKSPYTDANIKYRCCSLLVETLISHEYLDSHINPDFKAYFFQELMDCIACFLPSDTMQEYLRPDKQSEFLLDRLMILLVDSYKSSSPFSTSLSYKIFWSMMILSDASPEFWSTFKDHSETAQVVEDLLLRSGRTSQQDYGNIAIHPVVTIKNICTKDSSTRLQFLQFFWPMVLRLVPAVTGYPRRCQMVLELVQVVLGQLVSMEAAKAEDVSLVDLDLGTLAIQWGQLLISHKVVQYVGRPSIVDPVTYGLASLLRTCIQNMQPPALEPLQPMVTSLFKKHLFPEILDTYDDSNQPPLELPLLDTMTRSIIVEIILALSKNDPQGLMNLMKLTTNLIPCPPEEGDYLFELSQGYDRAYEIRSETGYVGLKNLSNTCYLNSLMAQLFMNISFRKVMINAHVAEGGAQKLLQQTRKLFSEMQNSLKRCANPAELATAIKTYDETPIDVTIQMDVDEFYNLLFDRWEGQILAPNAKAAFRSFYGGQLVQQVKSKECAHISERLEPFSAIQCDIKGKQSLEESLRAYVDGEIMEGDNKYKCSTCDQHVDAVKRACLKDVPDNLIFHLKRFDYNLREGRRSKLNDYFSFPGTIDMRPYKVEYLTNGPEGSEEDIFELVGVLVHSGTAESGHYYSYIRERPAEDSKSWVEFNDDLVSPFDPTNIEACCFGGPNYQLANNEYQFDKSYSAYMLFYQRRSFLVDQKQKLGPYLGVEPFKLPLRPSEARDINDDNSILMRKYALYDPSHAHFVKQLLSELPCSKGDGCSSKHVMEDQALRMIFNHMDQVFSRTKDTPDFHHFVTVLLRMFGNCIICSKRFTHWISISPEACKHYLVKCGETVVRQGIAELITVALQTLKRDAPQMYGLQQDHARSVGLPMRRSHRDDMTAAIHQLNTAHGAFGAVVETLCQIWDVALPNLRAWPEYFGLVWRMMDGVPETALFLDNGLIIKVSDMIMASYQIEPAPEILRMLNALNRRSVNKPVSFDIIVSIMEKLLGTFQSFYPFPDNRIFRTDALMRSQSITMWLSERDHLFLHWTAGNDSIFVGELLRHNTNDSATESIIKILINKAGNQDLEVAKQIAAAITCHVGKNHNNNPVGPYLKGALIFCRYTNNEVIFKQVVMHIRRAVEMDFAVNGGVSYLHFFTELAELPPNRVYRNKELFEFCMKCLVAWAPSLLLNWDENARVGTENYIADIIIQPCLESLPSDDEDYVERFNTSLDAGRKLGIRCLEVLDNRYVQRNTEVQRSNVANIKTVIDACRSLYEEGSEMQDQFNLLFLGVWTNGMSGLVVTHLDDEASLGSDEWGETDGELSTSSLLLEDRDGVSLIENNDL